MPKQEYIVLKSSVRKTNGVTVDGHEGAFGKKSHAFTVTDAGLAKEMEARYGMKGEVLPGEVVIAPLNRAPDPLHRRTFTVPDMPWLHKGKGTNERIDRENGDPVGEDQATSGNCNAAEFDQLLAGGDCKTPAGIRSGQDGEQREKASEE